MSNGAPDALEDLSGNTSSGNGQTKAPVTPQPVPQATPQPAPGTTTVPQSQSGKKGKGTPPARIQNIQERSDVAKKGVLDIIGTQLDQDVEYEKNLEKLLNKALQICHHDREMAMALFQVHLDRGEELDTLPLTMPVAQVIGDNTGATLKALELAMKSGDRVTKVAELFVRAKKEDLTNLINYLKIHLKGEDGSDNWGDVDELPPVEGEELEQIAAPAEAPGD